MLDGALERPQPVIDFETISKVLGGSLIQSWVETAILGVRRVSYCILNGDVEDIVSAVCTG